MMKQVLEGLAHCHANRVFHRDLKPHNLLIDTDGNIKLADFGLARAFSQARQHYTHEVVTLWYRAPEILLGKSDYSLAVDMWSVGCIFSEMVMGGRVLLAGTSEIEQLFKIFHLLGTPTAENWSDGTRLSDYKPVFPKWPPKENAFQQLLEKHGIVDQQIVDLLEGMVVLDPTKRIDCR
jgi:cyclin-dependent kinase